ncbi:hypothetical protein [Xanthobacter sediminis]|uniref:hypothetical protein n=1 Tax=Xanthobacter sediminis TaxID=3119926 RepID=UPI00372B7B76
MTSDFLEVWKAFRSYEEHENALINHRISWFVTMQSVLIATFGFSIQKYFEVMAKIAETSDPKHILTVISNINSRYQTYLFVLCVIGFVVAYWANTGVKTAITAQTEMRNMFSLKHLKSLEESGLPDISGGGDRWAKEQGATFARWLPLAAEGLWIFVAVGTLISTAGFSIIG